MINEQILFNNMLSSTPDFLFWKDLDFTFIACNDNFAALADLTSRADIVGKTDYDLHWRNYADKYRQDDQHVFAGNTLELIENNVTPGGLKIISYTRKKPIYDNDKIVGLFGYAKILNSISDKVTEFFSKTNYNIMRESIQLSIELIRTYFFDLTRAESECLYFFIRGYTAPDIAEVLHRSVRTIEAHLKSARIKMNCNNKSELIQKSITSGFMHITPKSLIESDDIDL